MLLHLNIVLVLLQLRIQVSNCLLVLDLQFGVELLLQLKVALAIDKLCLEALVAFVEDRELVLRQAQKLDLLRKIL